MLSTLASLMLAAAPVAPPGTHLALVVPHPRTGLPALRSFLDHASTLAPTLAPGPLGLELGSSISTDLFDVATWEASGLDVEAPVTLAGREDDMVFALVRFEGCQEARRSRSGRVRDS